MIKLKYLVFLITLLCLVQGCGEDDADLESINFDQTVWKGTLEDYSTKKTYELTVWFNSDKVGDYRYKCDADDDESFKVPHIFFYEIDNRILFINAETGILSGYWWIIKKHGRELVFSSEPESPYASTLTLKKVDL